MKMTELKMPKVSVLIPCYNAEKTIVKTINSVLCGTLLPFEILIYDDFSKDDTVDIIERTFANHKLVHLTKGPKNLGAGHARNVLLTNAKGNYIAFLDADDFWYPEKLEKQIYEIIHGGYDIVTSGYNIFSDNDVFIGQRFPPKYLNYFTMHMSNWLPMSLTIFRKSLHAAQQMPEIRRRQDYGFWLTIFKYNRNLRCCVIRQPLGGYLRRRDSLSAKPLDNFKFNLKMFRDVMSYNWYFAFCLVIVNMIVRLTRT